ncbi:DUF2937 family protein [Pseudomonas sp. RIT-PI-AD]|uniref:DUF2937 family protein n=1 Tax=Pseudomonas sp. RIT-PI-AD TaxID=3035294 RepID=UPI0021DA25E1|nr:DUF2937 family protein [Pseudomonas sp. RIT-PI-AD]
MLRSYLRLVLFTLGLLVGVQVPGFIADYVKRVDAHRLESQRGLEGFQETARRFFDGDMNALVAHYRDSADPVMRSDAQSVAGLYERAALLDREWLAMQGPWYRQVWHLATDADQGLLEETRAAYSYQVLLAPQAIAWGLGCALVFAALVESLLITAGTLVTGGRRRPSPRQWR